MNLFSNIVASVLVRYKGVDNLRMTGRGARVFEVKQPGDSHEHCSHGCFRAG